MKVLKVLVLLVSIAGASALVWNATRDRKPEEARKEGVISPKSMQGSSKSKAIVDSGVILSFAEESGVPEVTDEEVKAMRDSMLNTSKSGIIMSDDKIREMLEKRAKLKDEKEVDSNPELLLSGSKSRVAISYDDLRKIAEEHAKQKSDDKAEPQPHLMSSSKSIDAILKAKDLKKIVEGEKQQPQLKDETAPIDEEE